MAGFTLFTVELIADSLLGPISAALASAGPNRGQPVLGLRLLDLPPSVLEAPEEEEVADGPSGRFRFGGRGKALMIELPDAMLEARGGPMPLWLMLLVRDPERPSNVATLIASACVDIRTEVDRASSHGRQGACAPCPFQRCTFTMTAVRNAGCEIRLDCLLRIFAGVQQPPLGSETLLEPAAVAVFAPGASLGSGDRKTGGSSVSSLAEREDTKQSCAVQTQTDADVDETSKPSAAASPADVFGTSMPSPDRVEVVCPTPPCKDGAFFPDEMRFGQVAVPSELAREEERPHPVECRARSDVTASSSVLGPLSEKYSAVANGPPSVPPSLPLVAEMLRELWQIRSIS